MRQFWMPAVVKMRRGWRVRNTHFMQVAGLVVVLTVLFSSLIGPFPHVFALLSFGGTQESRMTTIVSLHLINLRPKEAVDYSQISGHESTRTRRRAGTCLAGKWRKG
jgi:hypothetical protein